MPSPSAGPEEFGEGLAASDLAQLETKETEQPTLPSGPWLSATGPKESHVASSRPLTAAKFPDVL